MAQPLVIAYHLIWTAYGQWLPNDPRGSGSNQVSSQILSELGELHYGRKHIQPCGRMIREFYDQATSKLRFPVRSLLPTDFPLVAEALMQVITTRKYTCYACAIMPDHVHIVIRKHRDDAETMMDQLKTSSANRLRDVGAFEIDHPVWAGGHGWKVFMYHPDDVQRTIRYVQDNPRKGRLPDQPWSFVTGYDRWPLHPGHNVHSPYVKGLRAIGRYP